jgi:hypothetical protein
VAVVLTSAIRLLLLLAAWQQQRLLSCADKCGKNA